MNFSKYFTDKSWSRAAYLAPEAFQIMVDVIMWAKNKGLKTLITSTVSTLQEDQELNRVSATHREGRAFDLSTNGWAKEDIEECVRVFDFKYRKIAAMRSGGEYKLAYFHDNGNGPHIHFQINRTYAVKGVAIPASLA